jgi:hypothetical protein
MVYLRGWNPRIKKTKHSLSLVDYSELKKQRERKKN